MNILLVTALLWVLRGFAVIPINWRAKTPDSKILKDESWESYKTTLPTMDELRFWFPGRLHNLGLIMGWNNLVVIDFDNMNAYSTWRGVESIQTYEVKTARGMHVYFQIQEPVNNSHSELLDIKAHGYVLIPPSIHPSGYEYVQFNNNLIAKVERLADILPDALIPAPPPPTEFIPTPIKQKPVQGDLWSALDNPIDPDVDLLRQIRERVSLLDLIQGATPTSRGGRWYSALCPFHDDHHPSFWIDLHRGICGCRSCKMKPMDVVNLTAKLHGLSNREAIFYLAKELL